MNDFVRIKSQVKISDVLKGEGYSPIRIGEGIYKIHCINPNHNDKEPSLIIDEQKKIFKCFSCPSYTYGDVFNLLEYIRPDIPKGKKLLQYIEHQYLRDKIKDNSFPLLKDNSLSSYKEKNINNQDDLQFRKIMNYIALYWHSKMPNKILDTYILSNKSVSYRAFKGEIGACDGYNLSRSLVDKYLIGYSPNNKELYNILLEQFDSELIDSLGLFTSKGLPKFRNRITVPYFKNNDVIYFVARQTEFTPMNQFDNAKYMNQSISNKYMYNEDDLENTCIFITEGTFDCLAFKSIGYNAIAFGGIEGIIKLKSHIDKLAQCMLVYICLDNDGSDDAPGNKSALKLHEYLLEEENIMSHIITLPLDGKESKMDINKYLGAHSKEEFNKLLTF